MTFGRFFHTRWGRFLSLGTCFFSLGFAVVSCGNSAGDSQPTSRGLVNGPSLPPLSGSNVMTLTIDGSTCLQNNSDLYPNEPCVSVTICPPGSYSSSDANCQTINGLLLDTGSVGLRVFSSVLSSELLNALTPVASGGGVLTECMMYGDGSADWGPVAHATVFMGGEAGVSIPIQLINASYGGSGSSNGYQICNSLAGGSGTNGALDSSPSGNSGTGFNGILGVGLFPQDCGADCQSGNSNVNPQIYYSCSGSLSSSSSCGSSFVTVDEGSQQLQNPVASLSDDNNGVILELPSVGSSGAVNASGYVVFGIGTQSNNQPGSGVVSFPANTSGQFTASFNGNQYSSFLDSGSSLFFFPTGSSTTGLVACQQYDSQDFANTGYLCPSGNSSGSVSLSVQVTGNGGSPVATIPFSVGNPIDLLFSGNAVFSNIANSGGLSGLPSDSVFDLGLPFYLGRDVYEGFEGKSSSLGTGTFWAF